MYWGFCNIFFKVIWKLGKGVRRINIFYVKIFVLCDIVSVNVYVIGYKVKSISYIYSWGSRSLGF